MPRYDYECETCHYRFELRQGFDSEPVATCPECENRASRKFHSVPIVFKGSGWYVNDYGKRGGAKTSTSDSKESDSEPKSATKSESKDSSTGSAKSESATKSSPKSESTAKAKSD